MPMPWRTSPSASQLQVPDRVISASLSRIYIEITDVQSDATRRTGMPPGTICNMYTLPHWRMDQMLLRRYYRLFNDPSPLSLCLSLLSCMLTFVFWTIDRYRCWLYLNKATRGISEFSRTRPENDLRNWSMQISLINANSAYKFLPPSYIYYIKYIKKR